MRTIVFLFLILFSGISLANEGEQLHQSNCVTCHSRMTGGDGTVLYERADRIARTLNELNQRVEYCANGANAHWNKTQLGIVSQYLNESFYQY